ncbi:helix-turn-helix transcriptional regulator [Taklimakanibacter deserti]|uniref:helix-turn-helix transcriptional regulator n=1 Tax=Taklimakanibacter deserti TaxID=2267839 RepID=UPI000E64BCAA
MELLERDSPLTDLAGCLDDAVAGTGRIALIYGEAGIGKTALIEQFLAAHQARMRILIGHCDALFTPQPLSPLHDIALQTNGALLKLMRSPEGRLAIFGALLDELRSGKPTILVFEDVHWADAATLDLLKYLSRRIRSTPTLIVLSYRDDELDGRHALWSLLGNLPVELTRRVGLRPLTQAAVASLAGRAGRPAEGIHTQTGGNPFYVGELLASPPGSVPATVREATVARAMRLSPEARAMLDFCAVVPNRVERCLLEAATSSAAAILDECVGSGLMLHEDDVVMFRHELARQAIEGMLPQHRRRALHASVLSRLLERSVVPVASARLVHHAIEARDDAAVRRFAPQAARQASMLGAHREAAAHYLTALKHTADDDIEARAALLEGHAYECYLTDRMEDAIASFEAALALRRRQGNLLRAGDDLRWLSRIFWFHSGSAKARSFAMEAVAVLERLPPGENSVADSSSKCCPTPTGGELAMAYSSMAQLCMLSEDCREAVEWGERALKLAERSGLTEILVHALNNVGQAEFLMGKAEGTAKLERSLELALAHEMHDHVARAHTNLIYQALITRDYARAEARLATGLAYAKERDLDAGMIYQLAMRARAHLEQGRWKEAGDDASTVLQAGQMVSRAVASSVLGAVRLRQGDPGAEALLDEARELAQAVGDLMRIGPIVAARAEAAWLRDDMEGVRAEIEPIYELARQRPEPWRLGELGLWLWRAGALDQPLENVAPPYRLEISGDWQGAAAAWERLGCPYEQALALAHGDRPAQLKALDLLTQLGAGPAAALVRRKLRAESAQGIPRGPSAATKGNPLGLTGRQIEILKLLAEDLSNKAIAQRLKISPKTVDHHVVAVLTKLGVSTRKEAARHPAALALKT